MPPTTHLLLATVGGMILAFAIMLLVRWIKDKVNPPEVHIWDEVWIGDQIEGVWEGVTFKARVVGIEGTGKKKGSFNLIIKHKGVNIPIPYKSKKWTKVQ